MSIVQEISLINQKLVVSYAFLYKYYSKEHVWYSVSKEKWIKADRDAVFYDSVLNANTKAKREGDKKDLPSLQELEKVALAAQLEDIVLHQYYSASEAEQLVIHYGTDLGRDYAQASAWLRMLVELGKDKQAIQRITGYPTKTALREASSAILKIKELNGLKISNADSLRVSELKYKKLGIESVISSKIGNKNAQKSATYDFHDITLINLYMNVDKPSIYHIDSKYGVFAQYLEKCEEYNYPPMSVSWVKKHFLKERTQAIISKQRYGREDRKKRFVNKVRSEKVKYSNSRIALDGIPISAVHYGRDGELKWQYTLFPIFDVSSGAVIGLSHGYNENTQMFKDAMRMALHTANYKKFKEVVSDGFLKKNIQAGDILTYACEKHKAIVRNPQENEAERLGLFVQELFRGCPYWLGLGIDTKKVSSRANKDSFNAKNAPTYSAFMVDLAERLAKYNAEIQENGLSRIENYQQNFRKKNEFIHPSAIRRMFGQWTTRKIVAGTLEVEHKGETYRYAVPEYTEWLEHDNEFSTNKARVRVYFDPNDMSQVDICNIVDKDDTTKDRYKATLNQLELTSKTWSEHTEATKKALGKQLHDRDKTVKYLENKEAEYIEKSKQLVASELKAPFTNPERNGKYKVAYNEAQAAYYKSIFLNGVDDEPLQKAAGDGIDYSTDNNENQEDKKPQQQPTQKIFIPKRW